MDVPYKLYKGDCLEIMPQLEVGSVDAIITDLPYGTTACEWDSIIPLAPMWEQVKRVLKSNGAFITTSSMPFTGTLWASNPQWFKYDLVWNKIFATGFQNCQVMPLRSHEAILVFGDGAITYNPQMTKKDKPLDKTRWKNSGKTDLLGGLNNPDERLKILYESYPKSVYEYNAKNADGNNANRYHPSQKPIALCEYLIKTYTNFGETVLDITMGSGTTIIAAMKTGRKSIGIERDPKYFAIAEKRIKQAAQQPALLHEAQQSVQRTGGESAANLSLFPAEANPPAKVTAKSTRR